MENNIVESSIMEFALNGVCSSDNVVTNNDFGDSLNTDADKLTINFKNDKNFQFSSLPANVNTLNSSILSNSVYLTPKPTSRRLNEYNNLNQNHIDYIFSSEKLKRPFLNENSNLTDLDQNKRTKQCYYDTRVDNLLFKLSNLENNVNRLTEDNKFLRQEVKEVKELNAQLMDNVDVLKKRIEVIDKDTTENHIEMNDNDLPAHTSQILFSNLFKVDNNNKIPDPIHKIINIVNNNVEEKKKRELNLIVYGLKVDSNDKSFTTLQKLFTDIGVNNNNIIKANYFKKKTIIMIKHQ